MLDRLLDWMLVCTLREWFDPSEFRRTATTASSATERLVPARTSPAE
nr:cupin domain-containing protein [Streptomyces angustmyceticus]